MKTAMQKLIDYLQKEVDSYPEDCVKNIVPRDVLNGMHHSNCNALAMAKKGLEKEKEQLQKAFSDGQETPINHPTLPHYSREEYYNDNYNQNK